MIGDGSSNSTNKECSSLPYSNPGSLPSNPGSLPSNPGSLPSNPGSLPSNPSNPVSLPPKPPIPAQTQPVARNCDPSPNCDISQIYQIQYEAGRNLRPLPPNGNGTNALELPLSQTKMDTDVICTQIKPHSDVMCANTKPCTEVIVCSQAKPAHSEVIRNKIFTQLCCL